MASIDRVYSMTRRRAFPLLLVLFLIASATQGQDRTTIDSWYDLNHTSGPECSRFCNQFKIGHLVEPGVIHGGISLRRNESATLKIFRDWIDVGTSVSGNDIGEHLLQTGTTSNWPGEVEASNGDRVLGYIGHAHGRKGFAKIKITAFGNSDLGEHTVTIRFSVGTYKLKVNIVDGARCPDDECP